MPSLNDRQQGEDMNTKEKNKLIKDIIKFYKRLHKDLSINFIMGLECEKWLTQPWRKKA